MDVHSRDRRLNRRAYINVGLSGKIRVNTALQAYLCRPALPGFPGKLGNFERAFQIRGVACRRIFSALGKGAELAAK